MVEIGDIFALTSAATFAFSSSIMKYLNTIGTPAQLNFVRVLIGAIIFVAHLLIGGYTSQIWGISGLILLYLALSVIFNVVIGDTSFFEAQNKLGIKIATPLVNTYPYLTVVIAVLFLEELVTPQLLLGSLLLIPGVILLSLDKIDPVDTEEEESNRAKGLVYTLIATLSYSLGVVFITLGTENINPVVANSIRLPIAAVSLALLVTINPRESLPEFGTRVSQTSGKMKLLILLAGLLGTYFSSYFLVLSVQAIGASRSAILFSTGPLFALPIALFWLRERIGLKTVVGTILTIVGLWYIL